MKASTVQRTEGATDEKAEQFSLSSDLSELTKARLTVMVLLTTLAGYALSSTGVFDWMRLFHTLLGTTLVAICSSILNQALERDTDALMRRTQMRPFVTKRLPLQKTIWVGLALGAIGLVELVWFVNVLTAILAALTLFIYAFAYTPLKRRTELNTLVGTLPGALPPLMGATAATGHFAVEGLTLFALMTMWQLPHFYAIAWMHREDYAAGGLRMVSTNDATGRRTAWHALVTALILFPVSLLPFFVGHAGIFYAAVAGVLGIFFLVPAVQFARVPDLARARALFFFSIIYLPLVLTALAVDVPMRRVLGF